MPRFISKDGNHVVETSVATEAAELRRDGYTEQKARTAAVRESDAAAQPESPKSPKSN